MITSAGDVTGIGVDGDNCPNTGGNPDDGGGGGGTDGPPNIGGGGGNGNDK